MNKTQKINRVGSIEIGNWGYNQRETRYFYAVSMVGSSFDAVNKWMMSKVNNVGKMWMYRFALTLELSSSDWGRLVEVKRGNAICCKTHVVSSMAFKRSFMPPPVPLLMSTSVCLRPRAHQPRLRMTKKKPLAVPLFRTDQSGFSGPSRDNSRACWVHQYGCRFRHHCHHEAAKLGSLSERSGIAVYLRPLFCQFVITSRRPSLSSLCSFFCRDVVLSAASRKVCLKLLPCRPDNLVCAPSPTKPRHIPSTPADRTSSPTLAWLQ